jgi:hypothetical protein
MRPATREFLKLLLFSGLFLAMFLFWAAQCSAQSTFTRDNINTTRLTVLGSEKLFFSTDSTAPAVGYIKLWARDSTTLYLIRSSGVKVNLLSSAIDTSVLATQYDISLKSAAFGTIDTSGLAVNKILKWDGSSWTVRDDSTGGAGVSDSTTWIATDYDVSLKLNKTDTLSLSNRINLKLTATDTTGFRAYSNSLYLGQSLIDTTGKALGSVLKWNGSQWVDSTDATGAGGTLTWDDTSNALATDYDVSLKLNSAAIDTSAVLFWSDTLSRVATNYDLPVTRTDTVTAALDTLLVTVTSVSDIAGFTLLGDAAAPPIPPRIYRTGATTYVIKFDYDLTVNQPVKVTYWR